MSGGKIYLSNTSHTISALIILSKVNAIKKKIAYKLFRVNNKHALGLPEPPEVIKVTHFSIELQWNGSYDSSENKISVCIQEKDVHKGWVNIYMGYGKTHTCTDLEPDNSYTFRLRYMDGTAYSEWSKQIAVTTNKPPLNGENLHSAIRKLDLLEIESIFSKGNVSADVPDMHGLTGLMVAAQKDEIELMELLLEHGASVNLANGIGKTSLMLACFQGNLEAVKLLRQNEAEYEMFDKGGSSALHWAVDSSNVELIEWMIDDGADIEIRDLRTGWTPLLRCASLYGNRDVALALLLKGAEIDIQDNDGKTALMIAIINGHYQLLELLLQRKADITIKNGFGKTAYQMAQTMDKKFSDSLFTTDKTICTVHLDQRIIKILDDYFKKTGIKKY